jgi:HSP20 family protein
VDIYENEDSVVVKAELPGVDKKDIKVDLKDGVLTLTGERSHEKEVNEDKYYRKERAYGRFHRSFTVPAEIDPDKIKAEFKDGVLKVEIPKPEEQKAIHSPSKARGGSQRTTPFFLFPIAFSSPIKTKSSSNSPS